MTFRRHLLLASLTTLAVGIGALALLGNVLLAGRVHSENSAVLKADVGAQVSALSIARRRIVVRSTPNDAVLDQRSWVLSGARVLERPADASTALDRAATALGRLRHEAEVGGPGNTRLRSEPVFAPGATRPIGAVVVALSLDPVERLQKGVAVGSVIVASLILLAGGLAIRAAIQGALRPVAQMTTSVEDWEAHDLDKRFDLGPPRDELTGLAATLDLLLARIAASRRHEQRFAAEIAHELRTPLARLRLQSEVALRATGPGAGAECERALHTVVAEAGALSTAIDSLLAVARQEIDPARGTVDLATIAREVDGVTVDAPARLPLAEGDADVVNRALSPLIENARRHARSEVRLELSSGHGRVLLAVRDDGPGLDPELGEHAFDPGVRGSVGRGGAGLGLSLARRLARSCGGDISIGSGPGGCFVLELPALGRREARADERPAER